MITIIIHFVVSPLICFIFTLYVSIETCFFKHDNRKIVIFFKINNICKRCMTRHHMVPIKLRALLKDNLGKTFNGHRCNVPLLTSLLEQVGFFEVIHLIIQVSHRLFCFHQTQHVLCLEYFEIITKLRNCFTCKLIILRKLIQSGILMYDGWYSYKHTIIDHIKKMPELIIYFKFKVHSIVQGRCLIQASTWGVFYSIT